VDLQLKTKLALVTGSTAGIGLAIATSLAAEGARVIVNGRTETRVHAAIAAIRAQYPDTDLIPLPLDLGSAEGIAEATRQIPAVEILINNLGIFEPKPFAEIPDADWFRFFEVNVMSGVRLSRAYLPEMKRRNWGRILFISSESGLQIPLEMMHYGVTKTAQIALARGLAEECAGTGVTVNSVLPGPTRSEGVNTFVQDLATSSGKTFEQFEQEFFEKVRPTSLIKRFATPEEVAAMVCYLSSPVASATTGAALRVDGGVVKSPF
jgi:NAD(P)-dependent dehydrogenase (short-subunit alcohol dehydrogenase family)